MKNITALLHFCIFLFLNLSCNKDSNPEITIDHQKLYDCYESQHFDSTTLSSQLIGIWKWSAQSCAWNGKTVGADKSVKVNFDANGTFSVLENLKVVTKGAWKLRIVNGEILGLDIDQSSTYLYGRSLLCNNELLFNNSIVDGCDNLFIRQD